ncbi:MAG: hypothetical protein K2L80_05860, partial [Muribaculaceae bacterium]|nr:hypothetical protein [Muribaculaceae bacterium]
QLGRCFKIIPDQSLAYLQYRVVDSNGTELDLREDKDTNSSSTDKKNKAKKRLDGSENIADVSDDSTAAKSQKQKAKSKTKSKAAKPRQDMADGNTTQNDASGEVADSSAENSGSDTAVSVPSEKKPQPKNRKTSRPKAEKEATGESEDNTKTAEARDTRRKPANKANKKVSDADDSADGGTLVQTEAVPAEVLQTESVPAEILQKESVQSEDAAVQESAKADATRHKPVRQQQRRRTAPKVKTAEIADTAEKVTELPDVPVVRADHLLAAVGRQEANPDTAQE